MKTKIVLVAAMYMVGVYTGRLSVKFAWIETASLLMYMIVAALCGVMDYRQSKRKLEQAKREMAMAEQRLKGMAGWN
jgi:hypothetical protein